MSTTGFIPRFLESLASLTRTGYWAILVITTASLSLILVGLTVASDAATAVGTDSGRMALSFAVFLVLIAVLLGVPTVFITVRETLGRLGFLHTFLLSIVVGGSFLVAAAPAVVWAILSTGVTPDVWLPTLSTVELQVAVVAALVALAHWAIANDSTAATTAFGLVAGITLGPLLVVGVASFAPPVEQTTKTYFIQWKEDVPVDPETGYPINPICETSPSISTAFLTDYSNLWASVTINPVALVSASITPAIGDWQDPGYQGDEWESTPIGIPPVSLPLDLFSSVDLNVRGMQLPIRTAIVVDECANIAEFGTPYPTLDGDRAPRDIIEQSASGYTFGVLGQAVFVVAAAAILVPIRRRGRRA
ncbi:MAG: hypothetical protein NWS64_01695 [Microbacteriaceae bacterium]|nr:hypothetical protein [Microbacteriaceae bacterium]